MISIAWKLLLLCLFKRQRIEVRPRQLQAREVGLYGDVYHDGDLNVYIEKEKNDLQARNLKSTPRETIGLKFDKVKANQLKEKQVELLPTTNLQSRERELGFSIENEKGDLQARNIEQSATNLQKEVAGLGRFIKAKANQLKDKKVESLAASTLQGQERELGYSAENEKGDLQARNIEPSTVNLQREAAGLARFIKAKANKLQDKQMESPATALQSQERELGSHEQQKLPVIEQSQYGLGNLPQQSARVNYYLERGALDRPRQYNTNAGRARAMLALKLGTNSDKFG